MKIAKFATVEMLLGNEGLADILDVTVEVKLLSGELETELLLEKIIVGSLIIVDRLG